MSKLLSDLYFDISNRTIIGSCGYSLPDNINITKYEISKENAVSISKKLNCTINNYSNGVNSLYVSDKTDLSKVVINFWGSNNICIIGFNHKLHTNIRFHGKNSVCIISDSDYRESSHLSCVLWHDNQIVFWGKNSFAPSGVVLIVLQYNNRMCIVGDDCMMAKDTGLRNSGMHTIFDIKKLEVRNKIGDLIIEPHVWFGQESLVSSPLIIGLGSIIGAKSVVTKDIYPFTSNAGTPARVISGGVSWDKHHDIISKKTIDFLKTCQVNSLMYLKPIFELSKERNQNIIYFINIEYEIVNNIYCLKMIKDDTLLTIKMPSVIKQSEYIIEILCEKSDCLYIESVLFERRKLECELNNHNKKFTFDVNNFDLVNGINIIFGNIENEKIINIRIYYNTQI